MKKIVFAFVVATALAGCNEEKEKMVEPNAATCGEGFQAALSSMSSEVNRAAFIEECKSFQAAKKMRTWEFKPSPKDDY